MLIIHINILINIRDNQTKYILNYINYSQCLMQTKLKLFYSQYNFLLY